MIHLTDTQQQVYNFIVDNGESIPRRIVAETGLNGSSIRTALRDLEQHGLLTRASASTSR